MVFWSSSSFMQIPNKFSLGFRSIERGGNFSPRRTFESFSFCISGLHRNARFLVVVLLHGFVRPQIARLPNLPCSRLHNGAHICSLRHRARLSRHRDTKLKKNWGPSCIHVHNYASESLKNNLSSFLCFSKKTQVWTAITRRQEHIICV